MIQPLTNANPRVASAVLVGAGVIAALLVWSAVRAVGIEPEVGRNGELSSVGAGDVVVAALIGGFGAWAVHALMVRRNLASRWWPSVGSMALAISMIGPSYYSDGSSALALTAMHFAVGAVLIYGFAQLSPHPMANRR
jgi:hypothetical protein